MRCALVLPLIFSFCGCKSVRHQSELLSDQTSPKKTYRCTSDPEENIPATYLGDEVIISFLTSDTLEISGDYKGSKRRLQNRKLPKEKVGVLGRITDAIFNVKEVWYSIDDHDTGRFTSVIITPPSSSESSFSIGVADGSRREYEDSGYTGEDWQYFNCFPR